MISKLLPYITEWIAKDAGNKNFKLTKFSDKPLTLSDLNKEITVSSNHSMYYLAVNSNNLDKESIKKDQRIIQLGKSQNGSPIEITFDKDRVFKRNSKTRFTNDQLLSHLEKFKKVLYNKWSGILLLDPSRSSRKRPHNSSQKK